MRLAGKKTHFSASAGRVSRGAYVSCSFRCGVSRLLNIDEATLRISVKLSNWPGVTRLSSTDFSALAIGKSGQNVRLAAKLTGYSIDLQPSESVSDLDAAMQAAASRMADTGQVERTHSAFDALFSGGPTSEGEAGESAPAEAQVEGEADGAPTEEAETAEEAAS